MCMSALCSLAYFLKLPVTHSPKRALYQLCNAFQLSPVSFPIHPLCYCYRMEWVHFNTPRNRVFHCIEHKTRRLVCCHICCIYIHPCSFTIINVHTAAANINVSFHIKSAFTVYIYIYSFKVTSNENINTYRSMCMVVGHCDVHLSSSVPSFPPLFPLPNI